MNKTTLPLILSLALLLGCGPFVPTPPPAPVQDAVYVPASYSLVGMFDSMDTAIVEAVDAEDGSISLINMDLGKSYTLEYGDSTAITDKYGAAMSMAQIQPGEIVDVCFMKSDKKLVNMQLSPEAFAFENTTSYELDGESGSARIGDENYRLSKNALILSGDERIGAADIINRDIISIRGIGRDIWSISVEKGHGYLSLIGDAYAIGGWIEAGQFVIQRITDNMLLTLPEGMTDIYISARGLNVTKRVLIERNKETTIDLGDEAVEEILLGQVIIHVSPPTAMVYIDGVTVNIGAVVELPFGIHQIIAEALGYDTVVQHIKITEERASISIVMEEARADAVSDNNTTPDTDPDYPAGDDDLSIGADRVYIDAPIGAEAYKDGVYLGLVPVYFEKRAGSHTITLRNPGYITKSYQIHLDDEPGDVTYSFSALESNNVLIDEVAEWINDYSNGGSQDAINEEPDVNDDDD